MSSNQQKIIDRIASDARAEADAIIQEAQKEANEMIQAAEEKARKELAKYHELSQAEAQKAAAKEISGAHMNAKKNILSVKQEVLSETIRAAEQKLMSLPDDEYQKLIGDMLDSAEDGEDCLIIVSQNDKKRLENLISSKGRKLADETKELSGGFIVKKGDIEYNYSFESIVTVEREEMEKIAAEILFS